MARVVSNLAQNNPIFMSCNFFLSILDIQISIELCYDN